MKSFAFSVCLIFVSYYSFGQNSKIDLCEVYQHSVKNKSIDSITHILNLDSTQVNNFEKSELLTMRARLHFYLDQSEIDKRSSSDHPAIIKAHKDLTLAIDQYKDETDKLRYIFRRFVTLEDYKPHYKEYNTDLDLLTANGYKKDKFSIGLTALSRYDSEFWLGGELSFFSGYSPPFTLKDDNKQIVHQQKIGFSASVLIFGFSRNLESDFSDFSFSLLRIESPIFIDITQFGTMTALNSDHWYYRPELGFGYSIFHLSVGYNIFFRNQKSKELSNAFLSFRIKHTL